MATNRCSFLQCTDGAISDTSSRIEVCTAMPSKSKLKNLKAGFLVEWAKSGEASFHPGCWEVLIKAARKRGAKKQTTIRLTDTERSMLREAADTMERHDSATEIKQKAELAAALIKKAKSCVCFTGAGISTSAGIGDYRGKSGKWTLADRAEVDMDAVASHEKSLDCSPSKRRRFSTQESIEEDKAAGTEEDGVPYESLRPTYTHEALVKLMESGHLRYAISQNGDGLHLLSGIPAEKLSELHGNVFLEKCEKCQTVYERPFYVMDDLCSQYYEEIEDNGKTDLVKPKHAKQCDRCGLSHRTGRRCTEKGCKGFLMDTIINFRDMLEDEIYNRAYEHAQASDLMLCLGTTLTVTPANELVEMGQPPLRLIICNRQATDMDDYCSKKDKRSGEALGCRVFGDCDQFMREVMSHLLSEEELQAWEGNRPTRMEQYNARRQ